MANRHPFSKLREAMPPERRAANAAATKRMTKIASAFHDLCLSNADALVLRSNLMRAVRVIVDTFPGDRVAIAARVGLTRQRLSALLTDKLSKFSIEELISLILKLGQDVEISVTNSHPPRANGAFKIRLGDRKVYGAHELPPDILAMLKKKPSRRRAR